MKTLLMTSNNGLTNTGLIAGPIETGRQSAATDHESPLIPPQSRRDFTVVAGRIQRVLTKTWIRGVSAKSPFFRSILVAQGACRSGFSRDRQQDNRCRRSRLKPLLQNAD
ncbi:MAG: hypothetical protein KDI89_14595, partial [Gammaproteobacteria bacterium]|nr:hypothetical protein [Gammaproteobacteria bacterium]